MSIIYELGITQWIMHSACVPTKAVITIRTLSFITEGRCTYVQAVSRLGRQVHVETLLWKDFHCFQFYIWNALMCTLWLQHSSTDYTYFATVQSAVQPTNCLQTPLHVLALTRHTVLSCCSSTGWLPTATTVQWRTKWPPEQCSSEMPSCCQWSR